MKRADRNAQRDALRADGAARPRASEDLHRACPEDEPTLHLFHP
jgi:hypothetical protein